MDYSLAVRSFECLGNLLADSQRRVDRERSSCELLLQRRAFDQFEDEKARGVSFLERNLDL